MPPTVTYTVRYFAAVVSELVAAGIAADDIDATVDMLLADAHADHPGVIVAAADEVRANTNAALAILRG